MTSKILFACRVPVMVIFHHLDAWKSLECAFETHTAVVSLQYDGLSDQRRADILRGHATARRSDYLGSLLRAVLLAALNGDREVRDPMLAALLGPARTASLNALLADMTVQLTGDMGSLPPFSIVVLDTDL
jgi:hypothetical protein